MVNHGVGIASVSSESRLDDRSLRIKKGVTCSRDPKAAARELYESIHQPDISLAVFFCSSQYDPDLLAAELSGLFGEINLIGCTTAGEITPAGYLTGSLTGFSIASAEFRVITRLIENLAHLELSRGEQVAENLMNQLQREGRPSSWQNTFGFLLVDGLSCREEVLASGLFKGVRDIPIFGGSAADGTLFRATRVYHKGTFHQNCAVFSLIQSEYPFKVFKTQHFISSDKKMVITEAEPARRIVTEINGYPAGREYARMVGLEVEKLTPLIFSTYPVVVKIGQEYFVRSIQKVNEDESLTFFCAIDAGTVLTVAQGIDMVDNLEALFDDVTEAVGKPQLVIGCNCILRHLEMDQKKLNQEISGILIRNNVIGFSTYGEQFNSMHVNQTFTGVAIGAKR